MRQVMMQVDDVAVQNLEFQLLICKLCRCAVQAGSKVASHFQRVHALKGNLIQDLRDYYSEVPLRHPDHADCPSDGRPPIAELTVHHGFSCSQCRFFTIAESNIHTHRRKAHQDGPAVRFTRVRLQTWRPGRYAKYWLVRDVRDGQNKASGRHKPMEMVGGTDPADATRSQLERLLDEGQTQLEAAQTKRLRRGDREEGIDRDSAWVKDMRWVRHFGERELIPIAEATDWLGSRARKVQARGAPGRSQPSSTEEEAAARETLLLTRVSESFEREVERCRWRIDSVPKETLQKLQGITADASMGVPFGQAGIDSSIRKYCIIGQRYLCFCVRAYRLGRTEAEVKLAMRFTDEQWSLMADVMREADDPILDGPADYSGYASGGDSSEGEDDDQNEARSPTDEGYSDRESGTLATRGLDRAVFQFLVASIRVRVGGDVYSNALLCFCAAMGIRRAPTGFACATLYTGILAALHWLARLFFLEHVFEGEPKVLEEVGLAALERFQTAFATWMCVGTYTVMSKVINWMAYGKGHRKNAEGQPSVRWSGDKETLFHDGEGVSIQKFRHAAWKMMADADDLLNDLLGQQWGVIMPTVDLGRISDDMVRRGVGASFATHPENSWLEAGSKRAILAAGSQLWDARHGRWKKGGITAWMRKLRLFREVLLVAVHVWGGQPGRGPEVMTLRHGDSWQLLRNIFVYDGALLIVTDRDKMKAIRGIGRKVARFLPDRLGRMMVAYIAWLLPAEEALLEYGQRPPPMDTEREYLWRHGSSKRWEAERLSAILARRMKATVGASLSVGRYRMVAIAMGREIRGIAERKVEQAAGEADDDEDMDVNPLTGEVTDISGSWNIIWDLQSTHSTKMARQHYAVHVGFMGRLQPEMIASYRGVSQLWHQFLEAGGRYIPDAAEGKKRKHTGHEEGEESSRMAKRQAQDQDEAMVEGLRRLLGSTATWKSLKQRECMQAILQSEGDEASICVLPTGAGKSILFMLPAMLTEGGTSVVIVPFVALIEDLVDRARSLGVDVIRFDPAGNMEREMMPRAARLVVVSADVTSSASLQMYVDGLRGSGLLRRIFIDECHTIITDAGYRAKLAGLVGVRRYECPVIMLTATLPVLFESWFRREMLAMDARLIRDRTTKANCRYRVDEVQRGPDAVEVRVVEVVQAFRAGMLAGQKGVVYCRSKKQCEALAEAIGCPYHHSDMAEDTRERIRTAWASGQGDAWIVATTGLGTGIDIGGITAVVHAEQPYGLVDFVQQTGRGGRRAGEVVDSVIVHDGRAPYARVGANFIEKTNQAQMEMFVSSGQCRRSVLSSFMDGEANETCAGMGADVVWCDICTAASADQARRNEAGDRSREASPGRLVQFNQEQGQRLSVVRRWLEEVADGCPVCHVRNHERLLRPGKTWKEKHRCAAGRRCFEQMLGSTYTTIRQKVQFGANACCYRCKLPSDWCEGRREEEGICAYMDKILPVVLLAGSVTGIRRIARAAFSDLPSAKALDEFCIWLAEGRRFHDTKGANVHGLWEEIIWQVYKKGSYWFR